MQFIAVHMQNIAEIAQIIDVKKHTCYKRITRYTNVCIYINGQRAGPAKTFVTTIKSIKKEYLSWLK